MNSKRTAPLLSIIVPVYNVEPFIEECLDSIFEGGALQADFEVIVVNDGTKDASMEHVAKYITSHDNLVIANQDNQGLSAARMKGLSQAHGEYVWFVDSDDWLAPDAVSTVLDLISQTRSDVLSTPLLWCYDDPSYDHLDYDISSPKQMDGQTLFADETIPIWAATRYIIKRNLFDNEFLVFPEGLLHEDEYFWRVLMMLAKTVTVYDKPVYHYRQRSSSIMQSISIRSSFDIVAIYDRLLQFADTLPAAEKNRFTVHSMRLLVKSYTINHKKWGTREFNGFKRKKQIHLLSEYLRMHKAFSIKEFMPLLLLTIAPVTYGKIFPDNK